jgi:putative lipoprotein
MKTPTVVAALCALALTHGVSMAASPDTTTWVFVCDDQTAWVLRGDATGAWVFSHQGTRRLPAVPADSGRAYSDSRLEIRIEGETARIAAAGAAPRLCRNDHQRAIWEKAKLDGVSFRATGNEPGWTLEMVKGASLMLVTDYGKSRVVRPLPEPSVDRDRSSTRWDAGEVVVEVTGRPCRDSMSGEAFESTVVVTWKGRSLHGCGRALH